MMTYWRFKRHGSRDLYSLCFNYIFFPSPVAVGFIVYTGANQAENKHIIQECLDLKQQTLV